MSPAHSDSLDVTSLQDGDVQASGSGSLPFQSKLHHSPVAATNVPVSSRSALQSAAVLDVDGTPVALPDQEIRSEPHSSSQQNMLRTSSARGSEDISALEICALILNSQYKPY
jgi:hypothetical protein